MQHTVKGDFQHNQISRRWCERAAKLNTMPAISSLSLDLTDACQGLALIRTVVISGLCSAAHHTLSMTAFFDLNVVF